MRLLSRCAKPPKSFVRHFKPEGVVASCALPFVRMATMGPQASHDLQGASSADFYTVSLHRDHAWPRPGERTFETAIRARIEFLEDVTRHRWPARDGASNGRSAWRWLAPRYSTRMVAIIRQYPAGGAGTPSRPCQQAGERRLDAIAAVRLAERAIALACASVTACSLGRTRTG